MPLPHIGEALAHAGVIRYAWQLWIERGKTPLPRKMVITTTQEASQPQYVALLKWDLAPKLDDAVFKFVPPKDAKRIAFAPAPQGQK